MTGSAPQLCPVGQDTGCVEGDAPGAGIHEIDGIRVPHTGAWSARVWLRDAAGNSDDGRHSDPVNLLFDDRGPSPHAFEATDPEDPHVPGRAQNRRMALDYVSRAL